MSLSLSIYIYIYIHIYIYVYTHMYVYIYIYIYTSARSRLRRNNTRLFIDVICAIVSLLLVLLFAYVFVFCCFMFISCFFPNSTQHRNVLYEDRGIVRNQCEVLPYSPPFHCCFMFIMSLYVIVCLVLQGHLAVAAGARDQQRYLLYVLCVSVVMCC